MMMMMMMIMRTEWSIGLPEKLTGSQPVKKFPAFYGTRIYITAFTEPLPPLPIPSQIPFLEHLFNIILPCTPESSKWPPSLRFPHQSSVCTSPLPIRAKCPAHLSFLDFDQSNTW